MESLARTANRGSISTGFDIDNSLKLEEDNSEYLERATGGGNGSTTQHTISVWVKRTELTKTSFILGFANIGRLRFESDDKIEYQFRSGRKIETNRLFRDTSAWYHIVVVADSTLATSTDRMKLYINGVRETDLLTYVAPDQNQGSPAWGVYNTYNYRIGYSGNAGENFNGYIADAYYINGQTLDPTDFGEFDSDTGIWKPKEFTGTFGSLDNYLNFSNSSNLGEDANGGTDLSSNNITSADQALDTPTNNFATLNPLGENHGSAVISDGATKIDGSGSTTEEAVYSSICVTSGKWYAEVTPQLGSFNTNFGIVNIDTATFDGTAYNNAGYWLGNFDSGAVIYYYANGSGAGTSTVNFSTGDVIGLALDLDNNTLDFYVNGSQNKQMTSLPSGTYGFIADVQGTGGPYIQYNFGGYTLNTISSAASDANGYGTFEYAPPSGYYALCTKNLAEYG